MTARRPSAPSGSWRAWQWRAPSAGTTSWSRCARESGASPRRATSRRTFDSSLEATTCTACVATRSTLRRGQTLSRARPASTRTRGWTRRTPRTTTRSSAARPCCTRDGSRPTARLGEHSEYKLQPVTSGSTYAWRARHAPTHAGVHRLRNGETKRSFVGNDWNDMSDMVSKLGLQRLNPIDRRKRACRTGQR